MAREPQILVYQIENTANGKLYVGVTQRGLARRWRGHRAAARAGRRTRIAAAIRKYSAEAFSLSVLQVCDTYGEALSHEMRLISELKPAYNITKGGAGRRAPITSEMIQKLRAAMVGRPNPFLGQKHTDATKEKMRVAATGRAGFWKGKKRPPETVEKISRGGRANPARYWLGKVRDDETRRKISATKQGRPRGPVPPQIMAIFAENMRRAARARQRPVVCLNSNIVYPSVSAAAADLRLAKATVSAICNNKRTNAYGLRFQFYGGDH